MRLDIFLLISAFIKNTASALSVITLVPLYGTEISRTLHFLSIITQQGKQWRDMETINRHIVYFTVNNQRIPMRRESKMKD